MLRFQMLGGLDLRDSAGRRLEHLLSQSKRLALLAYLSVPAPGTRLRRDVLLGLFWPDLTGVRARAALRQVLRYLREHLGEDVLLGSGSQEIGLNPLHFTSDVNEFEAALETGDLEQAVALYRGDLLEGFHASGASPEFDHWLDRERDRLRTLATTAAWTLAERCEAEADEHGARNWARRALDLAPFSEVAFRRYLGLLDRISEPAEAVAAYEEFERRFQAAFDALPSAETRAAVDELRARLEPVRTEPAPEEVPRAPGAHGDFGTEAESPRTPALGDAGMPAPTESAERATLASPGVFNDLRSRWRKTGGRNRTSIYLAGLLTLVFILSRLGTREGWHLTGPVNAGDRQTMSVVVLPFRVTGADPSLAYLGQGLMDLLATRLTGDVGPRAVDPTPLLRTWSRVDEADGVQLSGSMPLRLARELGADGIVVGTVVGDPHHLVLSATLYAGDQSKEFGRVDAEGPVDSLSTMVDRLAGQLLAISAGESATRLANVSLPAIRSYLKGQRAYRSGHYEEARRHFQAALERDPTFGQAALGLVTSTQWIPGLDHRSALRTALKTQSALAERERLLLTALAGLLSPKEQDFAERLTAWERAVQAMPERPDAWYWLGDLLYHEGPVFGLSGAHKRARGAFARSVALDSTFMPSLTHLLDLSVATGDTATVRSLFPYYLVRDSSGDQRDFLTWRIASFLGDTVELRGLTAHYGEMATSNLIPILGAAQLDGRALDHADSVARILLERTLPKTAQFATYQLLRHYALNRGRPTEAVRFSDAVRVVNPATSHYLQMRILDALFSDGDSAIAEAAVQQLTATVDRQLENGGPPPYEGICVVELWRLWHGQTQTAQESIGRLMNTEDAAPDAAVDTMRRGCATVLETLLAHADRRTVSMDGLERLSTGFGLGLPGWENRHAFNLVLARIHEERGDLDAALAAVRRRPYHYTNGVAYLSTFLREEGRLAALTGDTAGALRAYRHYLALRSAPEPGRPQQEADRIRSEVAKLLRTD